MDFYLGEQLDKLTLKLKQDELHHCFKVMRKREGDQIGVIDGKGNKWIAQVATNSPSSAEVLLIESIENQRPSSCKLHIAMAPTKNMDRIEWFLEKATETGINEFTLLYTQRTERKKVNIERLQKIATSALKQSAQWHLPIISECKWNDFLKKETAPDKFVASCKTFSNIQNISSLKNSKDLCVLIGPEGDFTDLEYEQAIKNGFTPLSLGPQRFRTETAALLVTMAAFVLE